MKIVVVSCLSLLGGLALVWLGLAVAFVLVARGNGTASLTELKRLLPDLLRLLHRLARDEAVPRGVRVCLWLGLGYLLLPIDLIPDFIPVIGYLDDVIVVALTLRWVIARVGKQMGIDALRRNWPGSPAGLNALLKLCRVGRPAPTL